MNNVTHHTSGLERKSAYIKEQRRRELCFVTNKVENQKRGTVSLKIAMNATGNVKRIMNKAFLN